MKTQETESFDDPALKAAVRKAWQAENAPEALRRQVAAMLVPAARPTLKFHFALRPVLAAAVLVLGISAVVFQIVRLSPVTPPRLERHMMSASLIQDLAGHHDAFATKAVEHAGAITDQDLTAASAKLSDSLHLPVLTRSPGNEFEFQGALTFDVSDSIQAGHQFFKHGADSVSIFTLPLSTVSNPAEGMLYGGGDAAHPMSGFVQNGAFYCVVVTGPNVASCQGSVATVASDLRAARATHIN